MSKTTAARAARPAARYINVTVVRSDASTVATQVYTADMADAFTFAADVIRRFYRGETAAHRVTHVFVHDTAACEFADVLTPMRAFEGVALYRTNHDGTRELVHSFVL